MSSIEELWRENLELRTRVDELERAGTVVRTSSEAITSTALDGTILWWNAAAERLYLFTPGEAIGRSHLEIIPFERLTEHADAVARALSGVPVILETRRRRQDGSQVVVRVLYSRLADEDGRATGFATMAHTLT